MRIEVIQHIDAPLHRVFAVFTDLERAAERIEGIESLGVLTEPPFGVGTRWTETRRMGGRSSSETMTITAFDPPRSYTAEARSCGAHYISTFTFEPAGAGTAVSMSFAGRPTNLLSKLFLIALGALMRNAVKRMMAKDLADLQGVCESLGE
ncbi:MAG: SRPBCC family protein [Phycisphaeraceae bacterium]